MDNTSEEIGQVPDDFKAPKMPEHLVGCYSLEHWRKICWSDRRMDQITELRKGKRKERKEAAELEKIDDMEIDFG